MDAIRFDRAVWTVYRLGRDQDGRVDDATDIGMWWTKAEAEAECQRLASSNQDADVFYEVVQERATGAYPADEAPPWVDDPERLKRRGYEVDR